MVQERDKRHRSAITVPHSQTSCGSASGVRAPHGAGPESLRPIGTVGLYSSHRPHASRGAAAAGTTNDTRIQVARHIKQYSVTTACACGCAHVFVRVCAVRCAPAPLRPPRPSGRGAHAAAHVQRTTANRRCTSSYLSRPSRPSKRSRTKQSPNGQANSKSPSKRTTVEQGAASRRSTRPQVVVR